MRLLVLACSLVIACEPKATPPNAETGGREPTARAVATAGAQPVALAKSPTLHRPCTSHAACSDGELCFTDTNCSAGSCQKAVEGCRERTCACVAPALCRTACVDQGACVSCTLPPPPP